MTDETAEFVIYIINAIANAQSLYPSHVYKTLQETGCIQKYLVPFYDILHTMGTESIMRDVKNYLSQRGVSL
jgi:hypothetical protein